MDLKNDTQLEFVKDSAGKGRGAWFLSRFLYWDKTIKKSLIALERAEEQINKILGFFAWLVIFAGWLAFAAWIFFNRASLEADPLKILFFWSNQDILVSFFLLSLWFDLFLFYKFSLAAASAQKINYLFFL
jgi:hypothetical protein